MRKLFFIFLTVVFIFPWPALAQEGPLTLDKAYADYLHTLDLYRKARDSYTLARLNYLSSKTLASKSAAESATLTMLEARDDVVVTHLTALRAGITETPGISDGDKGSYYSQIDDEVNWYKNHKSGLPSAGSLENLVDESQKAKDRYVSTTELLMYNALGRRELGKIEGARGRIDKIISDINSKLGEIRQNGDKNTQKAERWLLETDARLKRSDQKKEEAKVALSKLSEDTQNRPDKYGDFQGLAIESNQFLKEATSYLKEIIKEIKTAD